MDKERLRECRDCTAAVSFAAETCPECGAPKPARRKATPTTRVKVEGFVPDQCHLTEPRGLFQAALRLSHEPTPLWAEVFERMKNEADRTFHLQPEDFTLAADTVRFEGTDPEHLPARVEQLVKYVNYVNERGAGARDLVQASSELLDAKLADARKVVNQP